MKRGVTNLILIILGALLIFEPAILAAAQDQIPSFEADQKAQEEWNLKNDAPDDESTEVDSPTSEDVNNSLSFFKEPPTTTEAQQKFLNHLYATAREIEDTPLTFKDKILGNNERRIVLNGSDQYAIQALYCLSDPMIDFENDFPNLANLIKSKPYSADELSSLKFADPEKFGKLIEEAKKNWGIDNRDLLLADNKTISCVSGLDDNQINEIRAKDSGYLAALIDDAISSIVIDIRVLNTLVYLVTDKNKGGAGHYRIKVHAIRKGYESKARAYSRESTTIEQMLKKNEEGDTNKPPSNTYSEANNFGGKTASEIGMTREVKSDTNEQPLATATVEDKDGTAYDATLSKTDKKYQDFVEKQEQTENQTNVSAHHFGQAVDIEEIDDIRCTMIKKRRVGGDKKTKYSQQPIRLAWQTSEGYNQSGGNDQADMSTMFKSLATESIQDLIGELGGDISNYQGDLSKADFSDIMQILGQSLLSEVLNSPGANLSGYSIEDTMQKMGSMYFADFLGLPREIFLNRKLNSIDDLQALIGESAIEKRLNLPFGTFTGNNLDETLTNIGRRKIEYEMGLDPEDLKGVLDLSGGGVKNFTINMSGGNATFTATGVPIAVGKAVIEKTLNLQKGSFLGKDFAEVKKNVGKYKGEVAFMDLVYLDTALHLDPGTTQKFKSGQMNALQYETLVGQTRIDDTIYGFKYLSAHDSAYNLPIGTWESAVKGTPASLKVIGTSTLARSFTKNETEQTAFVNWVTANTGKTSDEDCKIPDKLELTVAGGANTKPVILSEDKAISIGLARGDLFRLFGCAKSSSKAVFERVGSKILYYAITNYALNPEEKAKIDLADVTPEFHSGLADVDFYLTRVNKIKDLMSRMQRNWSDMSDDVEYQEIADTLKKIMDTIGGIDTGQFKPDTAKDVIKKVSIEIDSLEAKVSAKRGQSEKFVNKINGLMSDLNELVRLTTEIIEGASVPGSGSIKFEQIPTAIFSSEAEANKSASRFAGKTPTSINRSVLMLVLAGKISPRDFFLSLGTIKAEEAIGLPQNSLAYYIQNVEKKGLSSKDAFFQSIGQARIEEEFNMPSYYFQGPVLQKNMPDFENDMDSLMQYLGIKSGLKDSDPQYFTKMWNMMNLRSESPDEFKVVVAQAKQAYLTEYNNKVAAQGGNVLSEKTIEDVVQNVKQSKLADGIRSPDADVLFRMGIPGSLQSLKSQSTSAWESASTKMTAIDKKFWLKPNTTASLFSGKFIPLADGTSNLSQDEKQVLAANFQISIPAIEKYLQYLNKDASLEELKASTQGIYYNESNPWAPKVEGKDGLCPVTYSMKGGFNIAPNLIEDKSYVYVDQEGTKSFKSKSEALRYSQEHADKKIDTITEIANGLASLTNKNPDETKKLMMDFLTNNSVDRIFDDATLIAISQNTGIPMETLEKMFVKSKATLLNNPLQAYKKAVGQAEAKRAITWKLFGNSGLADWGFSPDDMYDILNGNYKTLYKIGTSYVDKQLHLPSGTTQSIVFAKSLNLKNCSLAEAGASLLGGFVGLNYVSLKGNILNNFGSAKIEQVLGLPRDTFRGSTVEELVDNTGPVYFALAFKIPLADTVSDRELGFFYDAKYVSNISKMTGEYKVRKLKEYLDISPNLNEGQMAVVRGIEVKIRSRILDFIKKDSEHWKAGYTPTKDEFGGEVTLFHRNLIYLDSAFGLSEGTTKGLLNGEEILITDKDGNTNVKTRVTPDRYRELVATRILGRFAALKVGALLGLTEDQSSAVYALFKDFKSFVENKKYGDIYEILTRAFNLNLDAKAGFDNGTIKAMLNNPKKSGMILLGQAINEFDKKLGLAGTDYSFGSIYKSYLDADTKCDAILSDDTAKEVARQDTENSLVMDFLKDPTKVDAVHASYNALYTERALVSSNYNECKQTARTIVQVDSIFNLTNIASQIIDREATRIAAALSDKIFDMTDHTLRMPVEDIKKLTFDGDMRYLTVAGLSYAANVVVNPNGKGETVPPYLRISYDDIKLAIMGSKAAEDAAAEAAVTSYLATGTVPVLTQNYSDYMFMDMCPENTSNPLQCLSRDEFLANASFPDRSFQTLEQANLKTMQNAVGYSNLTPEQIATAQQNANDIEKYVINYDTSKFGSSTARCGTDPNDPEAIKCIGAYNNSQPLLEIDDAARRHAKKLYMEQLQFRAMDAMLWKVDKNVYPGFAYAMMRGSSETRSAAMANYLLIGIERGELFNIDIGFKLPRADMWIKAYNYLSDPNSPDALNNFISNGGYDFANNFVNQNAKNWFGIDLPPDTLGAIVVGVSTGAWRNDQALSKVSTGMFNEKGDYLAKDKQGKVLKTLPTLESVVRDFAASKLFAWGDKALGLPVGSTFQLYTAYRTYVNAKAAYETLKTVKTMADVAKIADTAKQAQAAKAIEAAGGSVEKATSAAGADVQAAMAAGIAIAVNIIFAEQIADMEVALGLVPGTGSMLVTMMIVGFDPVTLGIFILVNLLGYYKVEIKCSADGYYPEIDSPQYSKHDITNLGVWDGMNAEKMKYKSIEAAQYKARVLIGDVINMQFNPKFKDVIPSQILTGRKQDVEFWNVQNTVALCSKIGAESIAGVCGGETRAGIWKNSQTVAWTHIGF